MYTLLIKRRYLKVLIPKKIFRNFSKKIIGIRFLLFNAYFREHFKDFFRQYFCDSFREYAGGDFWEYFRKKARKFPRNISGKKNLRIFREYFWKSFKFGKLFNEYFKDFFKENISRIFSGNISAIDSANIPENRRFLRIFLEKISRIFQGIFLKVLQWNFQKWFLRISEIFSKRTLGGFFLEIFLDSLFLGILRAIFSEFFKEGTFLGKFPGIFQKKVLENSQKILKNFHRQFLCTLSTINFCIGWSTSITTIRIYCP